MTDYVSWFLHFECCLYNPQNEGDGFEGFSFPSFFVAELFFFCDCLILLFGCSTVLFVVV